MKSYRVLEQGRDIGFDISGENLVDAIENNFHRITRGRHIGSITGEGYYLEQVWMEYVKKSGSKNGVICLHIIWSGHDGIINYDPYKDLTPKECVVEIAGSIEDCPERFDFELAEKAPFDPFDKLDSLAGVVGTFMGLVDEVAEFHSQLPKPDLTGTVSTKYPNMIMVNLKTYTTYVLKMLHSCRPHHNAQTTRLMERIEELSAEILSSTEKSDLSNYVIYESKTRYYFRKLGKITALAFYRQKAGLSQQALAEKVGVTERQIQRYEKVGGSNLGVAAYSFVVALAEALGVKPGQLVDGQVAALVDDPARKRSNKKIAENIQER